MSKHGGDILTIQQVKQWLNRAYGIDSEINELLREQKKSFAHAVNATSSMGNEKTQVSKGNTSEKKFVEYAAYSERIDRRIDELYVVKQEILSAINKLDDSRLRTLLIARYINFRTWDDIAYNMNYSRMHVYRLHGLALQKIKDVIECYIAPVI